MTEIYTLDTRPSVADFTPLSEHQEQTPSSFFGARPVLHYTLGDCDLLVAQADLSRYDFLGSFDRARGAVSGVNGDSVNGGAEDTIMDGQASVVGAVESLVVVQGVKGFVTSESLILYVNPTSSSETSPQSSALSIPYHSITLHATQRVLQSTSTPRTYQSLAQATQNSPFRETQAIYLQLDPSNPELRDASADDDESEALELYLVPHEGSHTSEQDMASDQDNTSPATAQSNSEQVREIFEALSRCADLHPDTGMLGGDDDSGYADGEGSGGGLAAMLGGFGGGQWITAENAHEFEGQFAGDDDEDDALQGEDGANDETVGLGPGAGTRRPREGNAGDTDGHGDEARDGGEESKWQRTE